MPSSVTGHRLLMTVVAPPDKTIIPYCQGGYRSANTYLVLRMLGYPQVRNYLGSWSEWGNRDDSTIVIPGED